MKLNYFLVALLSATLLCSTCSAKDVKYVCGQPCGIYVDPWIQDTHQRLQVAASSLPSKYGSVLRFMPVSCTFHVGPFGGIHIPEITKSSGSRELDGAVVEVVKKASPLKQPSFPFPYSKGLIVTFLKGNYVFLEEVGTSEQSR